MNFLYKLVLAVFLDAALFVGVVCYGGVATYKTTYDYDRVKAIYQRVLVQTGQAQDSPYLEIIENPSISAFTDRKRVVIFRGMLNFVKNDDELALVIGHEIAHDMLRHTYYREFSSSALETSIAEANADKMGALYILKAGYNVCNGRELWKRLEQQNGNYQGGDHPTYSYRYDELNIQCGN